MKKYLLGLLVFGFMIAMASCEDDPVDPIDIDDDDDPVDSTEVPLSGAAEYHPLEVGNYWVYEFTYEDENGQPIEDDPDYETYSNTLRVEEEAEFEGRTAFRISTSSTSGDEISDQWYSADEDAIYVYVDENQDMGELEGLISFDEIPSGWMKVFSMENETIELAQIDLDQNIDFGELSLGLSGDLTMKLKTEENGTYNYEDNEYESRMSTGISDFDGDITIMGLPGAFPISAITNEESIYIKGIGIVETSTQSEVESTIFEFIGEGVEEEIVIERSMLIEYSVK